MQKRIITREFPILTATDIALFLQSQQGQTSQTLSHWNSILNLLLMELPEGKLLTREDLDDWRKSLADRSFEAQTVTGCIKCVNRYLVWAGLNDLCFRRKPPKDLTHIRFGMLTVLYPLKERSRSDVVWHCVCDCGRETDVPSTRLISGNTTSCGCRQMEGVFFANKYFEGTSITKSLSDRVQTNNTSGCPGVWMKCGRWAAQIIYKGEHYFLGYYDRLEDAIEVRKKAKELVKEDAEELLERFSLLYSNPELHLGKKIEGIYRTQFRQKKQDQSMAVRGNNTSGVTGVCRKRDKWTAKITWQGKTFSLGVYEQMDEAVRVRKGAEDAMKNNPGRESEALTAYRETLPGCRRGKH